MGLTILCVSLSYTADLRGYGKFIVKLQFERYTLLSKLCRYVAELMLKWSNVFVLN